MSEITLYPKSTVERDRMGNLKIWNYAPVRYIDVTHKIGWSEVPESTIYVQGEDDVESVLTMLDAEERKSVEIGYIVETTNIDPAIFGDEASKAEAQDLRDYDDAEQLAIDSEHLSAIYPRSTIMQDWLGHLEIWDYAPVQTRHGQLIGSLPESTIYVQVDADISAVLEMLTAQERDSVERGYKVVTQSIDPAIFGDEASKAEAWRVAGNEAVLEALRKKRSD